MKYIIFEDFAGHPAPILFPSRISHAEMRELVPYTNALSAGYVELSGSAFTVYGHSVSLSLASRPGDKEIIMGHLSPEA